MQSLVLVLLTVHIFLYFYLVSLFFQNLKNTIEFYPVIGQQPLTMEQRFSRMCIDTSYYLRYDFLNNACNRFLVQHCLLFCYSCYCRYCTSAFLYTLQNLSTVLVETSSVEILGETQFGAVQLQLADEKPDYYENMNSSVAKQTITMLTARDRFFPNEMYVSKASIEEGMSVSNGYSRKEFIGDPSQLYRLQFLYLRSKIRSLGTSEASAMAQLSELMQAITDNIRKPHNSHCIQYNGKENVVAYQMHAITSTGVPEGTQPFAEAFGKHKKTDYEDAGKVLFLGMKPLSEEKTTLIHPISKFLILDPALRADMEYHLSLEIGELQKEILKAYKQKTNEKIERALFEAISENKILLQFFDLYPTKLGKAPSFVTLTDISTQILQLNQSVCASRISSVTTHIPEVFLANLESESKVDVAMEKVLKRPSTSPIQDFNHKHNKNFVHTIFPQAICINRVQHIISDPYNLKYLGSRFLKYF